MSESLWGIRRSDSQNAAEIAVHRIEEGSLFSVVGETHTGRTRETNEDAWWAAVYPPGSRNPLGIDAVAVVADGMGGHAAGEYASSFAVKFVREICGGERGDALKAVPIETLSSEIIELVNAELHSRTELNADSYPGTTITLALVRGSSFYLGHVGDSRAYLVSNNKAEQLTEDHTWAAEQVRQGLLSAEEAAVSPFRSQLVQAVGTRSSVEVFRSIGRLDREEALVLCTDGLFDYLKPSEIADLWRSSRGQVEVVRILIDLALERGGDDNVTVVLVRRTSSPETPTLALRLPESTKRLNTRRATLAVLIAGVLGSAVFIAIWALLARWPF